MMKKMERFAQVLGLAMMIGCSLAGFGEFFWGDVHRAIFFILVTVALRQNGDLDKQ